ncbi:integrase core domain-containing protein [Mycobacterium kansasii]|uniref:integrase core domain-containing protein n=1 Tax=Mycobacterium kansasii TaxID=1768 RepID=UPI0009F6F1AB
MTTTITGGTLPSGSGHPQPGLGRGLSVRFHYRWAPVQDRLDHRRAHPRICLNINSFWSLAQARVVISDWKHDYNHHRRHSALGYQAPAHYAATCTHQ